MWEQKILQDRISLDGRYVWPGKSRESKILPLTQQIKILTIQRISLLSYFNFKLFNQNLTRFVFEVIYWSIFNEHHAIIVAILL